MKINYVQGDQPNDPFAAPLTQPGYNMKRGKVLPAAKACWGTMVDANGRTVDPDQARRILDEALGD